MPPSRGGRVSGHVQVHGLRELRRDLRRAEDMETLRELREGLRDAAGIAATEAAQRAGGFSRRAADTIRPTAGGNTAYVKGGKAALPWYGWADFGGRTPVTGQPRAVGPWANSGPGPRGGRFIYAAIEAKERQIVEAVETAVDRALNRLDLPDH